MQYQNIVNFKKVRQPLSAVFLDRDGTINIDYGYVHEVSNFHFIDGSINAMQELQNMKFILVIITNQSGLARGFFRKDQFFYLTKWINRSLKNYGINLKGTYFCPHYPPINVGTFHQGCSCRKPKPKMLLEAQRHLCIDMSSSYMVGDKEEDMLAAKAAGVGTRVLVRSGKNITEKANKIADLVIDSLALLPFEIKQYHRVSW
ncbi:D-glycero-beta-D-manno-heptose 1,7-bisphosphate 7-phosphatase [Sodalis sp. CWE]|uniref:D-glycero-beta-D-manno-heptose 1,7-bisphosphate 7-phosphatase n=1 Tax=Sodalis sp. CWE TaxID=2803816 RepID=UPI001C7D0971|nr:D-glycero-beta-D-manno-heptose 1,7-bisphosphate 7-phosphatase [Sodalis sp. CWE]MBX4181217.1 D-glycero-beta-D-manno-heptose 1,7-bisphosphate 7-phosphatase [Sodalis sp. CWE]